MQAKKISEDKQADYNASEGHESACDVAFCGDVCYTVGLQRNNVLPPRRIGGTGNTDLNIQPEAWLHQSIKEKCNAMTIPFCPENDNTLPATSTSDAEPQTEKSIADHPVLTDINATCTNIERLEAELRLAKQQLNDEVKTLPLKVGDNKDLQDEIVHHLYWFNDHINLSTLKQTFKFTAQGQSGKKTPNVIRSAYIDVKCQTCKNSFPIEVKSRDRLTSELGRSHTCTACEALKNEAYRKENELYNAHRQQYLYHLQTMPYYEYLKTPAWQETRRKAMKRAGYRCQVCNAYGVQLNVHHRTYERRGREDRGDLITLCRSCHQIFHENGQIAKDGE